MNGIKYVNPGGGFVPNFPLTAKSDVNGAKQHPLYTYLKVIVLNVHLPLLFLQLPYRNYLKA